MALLLPFDCLRLEPEIQEFTRAQGDRIHFAPLLAARLLCFTEPTLPSYLILTSQNGVRSLKAQRWFGQRWLSLPVYGSGTKTCAITRAAGLDIAVQVNPPASRLARHLPKGRGIWISGRDIAFDLTRKQSQIERIAAYEMVLREDVAARLRQTLVNQEIDVALLTSARLARELAALAGQSARTIPDLIVLSERLANLTANLFPQSRLHIRPDFESAIKAGIGLRT